MKILGIETSCDETAVSVVEDGRRILSNVIASQVEMHARYGGVVPEVASRQHVLEMVPVLEEALGRAGLDWGGVDAIAVTNGPGLAGALLVGVNTAKALALATGLPLMGINHLEGHVYANWLEDADPESECGFPLMCLIASGGHTDLLLMEDHGRYTLLGRTRDDAAGEAFDKAARILGLGFPGGPEVQRAAQDATGEMSLPRAWMRGTHDFSFSGLKTAILHAARKEGIYPPQEDTPTGRAAGEGDGLRVPDVGCRGDGGEDAGGGTRAWRQGRDAGRRSRRQRHAEAGAPREVDASRVHSLPAALHGQRRHDRVLRLLQELTRRGRRMGHGRVSQPASGLGGRIGSAYHRHSDSHSPSSSQGS